jgi:ArsR family transcriptional regulator
MALGRLYLGGQCDCELHHNTTMHIIAIDASQSYQSLADRTRLRIAQLLAASRDECCLCELVDSLLEPQYNLSGT